MIHCKDCQHWYDGECLKVDHTQNREATLADAFEVMCVVSDDTNLEVALHTGPEFGCLLGLPHKEKGKA